MDQEQYVIKIQNFEGPLDLLLQLIEQEKLPITEISLVTVTDQYISFLKTFEKRSPEMLADFLVIAAKLLVIKSRALLPFLHIQDEEVDEDVRELEMRLKLYQQFKLLSHEVGTLWESPFNSYVREFTDPGIEVFIPPKNLYLESFDEIVQKILFYAQKPKDLEESVRAKLEKTIKLEEKIKFVQEFFTRANQAKLSELLKDSKNRAEVIVTFLALLELIKQNIIHFKQEKVFGEAEFSVKPQIAI